MRPYSMARKATSPMVHQTRFTLDLETTTTNATAYQPDQILADKLVQQINRIFDSPNSFTVATVHSGQNACKIDVSRLLKIAGMLDPKRKLPKNQVLITNHSHLR